MGWLFNYHGLAQKPNPKQLMEIYLENIKPDIQFMGYELVGKTYWPGECTLLWKDNSSIRPQVSGVPGEFYIVRLHATEEEWGYKDMGENDGPRFGHPTLTMLRKAEELNIVPRNGDGMDWRIECWNRFKAEKPLYLQKWEDMGKGSEMCFTGKEATKAHIDKYREEAVCQ
jgi:hypothetical protein